VVHRLVTMAVAHRRRKASDETPLPRFKVFVLLCITVSEGFALNMLFPFVPSMVESFGYTKPSDVSYGMLLGCRTAFTDIVYGTGELLRRIHRQRLRVRAILGQLLLGVPIGPLRSAASAFDWVTGVMRLHGGFWIQ